MPAPEPPHSKLVSRIQSGLIVAQFALFVAAVVTVGSPSQRGLPLSHRQNTELFLFLGLLGLLIALSGASHIYFRREEASLMQERLRQQTRSELVARWASERTIRMRGVALLCLGLLMAGISLLIAVLHR